MTSQAEGETQPIKLWSAAGRIGRLRYIAWSIARLVVLMVPVAFVGGMRRGDGRRRC